MSISMSILEPRVRNIQPKACSFCGERKQHCISNCPYREAKRNKATEYEFGSKTTNDSLRSITNCLQNNFYFCKGSAPTNVLKQSLPHTGCKNLFIHQVWLKNVNSPKTYENMIFCMSTIEGGCVTGDGDDWEGSLIYNFLLTKTNMTKRSFVYMCNGAAVGETDMVIPSHSLTAQMMHSQSLAQNYFMPFNNMLPPPQQEYIFQPQMMLSQLSQNSIQPQTQEIQFPQDQGFI